MRCPDKLAVLSHNLPPSWSGQAVILHRLFRGLDPSRYCLLSVKDYDPAGGAESGLAYERLPARYYHLPSAPHLPNVESRWRRLRANLTATTGEVVRRARQAAAIVRREKCTALLACSGDLIDVPAGQLAAQLAGVPYFAYLFDDYTTQWVRRFPRVFARLAWTAIARTAAGVIVPNEFLARSLERRSGTRPAVIHNPVDLTSADAIPERSWAGVGDEITIVYTGAIYDAHYDAFRNLLAAIAPFERPCVRLHVYTACHRPSLEAKGLTGPIVYHDHVSHAEARAVQSRAHIVFLPLAFESPYPEIIKTSSPAKMGEYLSCGRPTLVHSRADSFVSWYFRRHECGAVVDRSDPALVAEAVTHLIADPSFRSRVVRNAIQRARADFLIDRASARLMQLVFGHAAPARLVNGPHRRAA